MKRKGVAWRGEDLASNGKGLQSIEMARMSSEELRND